VRDGGRRPSTQQETLNDLQGILVADVCRWPSWGSGQGGLYGGRTRAGVSLAPARSGWPSGGSGLERAPGTESRVSVSGKSIPGSVMDFKGRVSCVGETDVPHTQTSVLTVANIVPFRVPERLLLLAIWAVIDGRSRRPTRLHWGATKVVSWARVPTEVSSVTVLVKLSH
jgi:hypothetical protein